MTSVSAKAMAEHIKRLYTKAPIHSFRRISEVMCEQYPDEMFFGYGPLDAIRGNQLHGMELVDDAAKVLREQRDDWENEQARVLGL